ncbi:F-box domain-containing protein [Medusavirus stheno T3]|uniref:F-box domain-containing protein n=1 Tax=Medusavirus stheno T3 TaxID=3069717 RepID=A0A7S7YEA7_9VIRU|nr:F-box domain-containing protein [Acanthamoeba castellanii medusavirus]QPB44191.1 F-box domain-containing protein [Medusavirus stheno T3]
MDTPPLPNEIWLKIAGEIDSVADLARFSAACTLFRDTVDDEVWHRLHLRLYGLPLHTEYGEYEKTWRWLCLAQRKPIKCRPITPANIELGSRGGRYYGDVYSNAGFLVPHGYGYWHMKDEETLEGEWKRGAMHGAMKATTLSGQVTATARMASNQPIESTIRARRRWPPNGEGWAKLPKMRVVCLGGPYSSWVPIFPSTN